MRGRPLQTAFTSGELDPRLVGRTDIRHYFAGASLLRNVLVEPQGGAVRRPGTVHVFTLNDAATGTVRPLPFAFNAEQVYLIVLTANRVRVFRDGTLVATVNGAPWSGAQVRDLTWCQSADTLFLFHPDIPPQRLVRGAGHSLWTLSAVPLTNVPTFTFPGGGAAEPVISAARGWPACGTLHQGRLWLGGLRSRPSTLLASKTGAYFDFAKGTGLDDEGIDVTLDTDAVNAVRHLASGRHLMVFTAGAEHAGLVDGPLTPATVDFPAQTRWGSEAGVRPVEIGGAWLFVQRRGAAVREFLYQDVEQAYASESLTLLAPHLVRGPVDLVVRKAADQDDADIVLMVNADGTVAALSTLRSQDVTAWTLLETDGAVERLAVVDGTVWQVARRTAGGVETWRIERWDTAALTDAAVIATGAGITTVAGLGHLEGRTVAIVADDQVQPVAVVTGGQVTLVRPAARVEVGLGWVPLVRTMPAEPRLPDGTLMGRRARIVEVTARLDDSRNVRLAGTPVAGRRLAGDALDRPPPAITGDVTVRGIPGWSERPTVEITQDAPGPFRLLSVALTLSAGAA
jgi:hypothetical protein